MVSDREKTAAIENKGREFVHPMAIMRWNDVPNWS